MFVVGLTGGIGSGKTTVSQLLHKKGINVVDSDVIARDIVKPNTPALNTIKQHFGDDIVQHDDTLNRKALRNIIFNCESEKKWLEDLLHPAIRQATLAQLSESTSAYTLYVSPLLIETKSTEFVDILVVVDANEKDQIKRVSKRDNTTEKHVKDILSAQIDRQKRLEYADFIIDNSTSMKNTQQQAEALHRQLLSLAKDKQS